MARCAVGKRRIVDDDVRVRVPGARDTRDVAAGTVIEDSEVLDRAGSGIALEVDGIGRVRLGVEEERDAREAVRTNRHMVDRVVRTTGVDFVVVIGGIVAVAGIGLVVRGRIDDRVGVGLATLELLEQRDLPVLANAVLVDRVRGHKRLPHRVKRRVSLGHRVGATGGEVRAAILDQVEEVERLLARSRVDGDGLAADGDGLPCGPADELVARTSDIGRVDG